MITTLIISLIIFVHIFFLWAILTKNFSVIDIGWGPGCLLAVLISFKGNELSVRNVIIVGAVALWGLRLGYYIFTRSFGKGEDPRYTKFREEWKPNANLHAYFKVFLFQGLLMGIVTLPATVSIYKTSYNYPLTLINYFGLLVFVLGLGLESYSDFYMKEWKSDPSNKGKICTTGPWSLCRFPNYFGEVMLWYGIYFLGFSLETSWSIIGAITINFLILKVTGVPLLEEKYKLRPSYQEYAKRVPKFIPFTKP